MDDNVDVVIGHPEEQMRLDQLETLVHEGGRVDRNKRPHVPGGVRQRLLCCHLAQFSAGTAPKGPPAGGEDKFTNLLGPAAPQALGKRRMLGIHRDQPGGVAVQRIQHQGATGDQ